MHGCTKQKAYKYNLLKDMTTIAVINFVCYGILFYTAAVHVLVIIIKFIA